MMTIRFLAATLLAGLALTGCGKEEKKEAATAEGRILERSVTDDMLPYDTVRSQPPLALPEDMASEAGQGSERRRGMASADETLDGGETGNDSATNEEARGAEETAPPETQAAE